MNGNILPWVVCGVLIASLVAVALLWQSRAKRSEYKLQAQASAHAEERAALMAHQTQELARQRSTSERDRAALQAEVDLAQRAAAKTRDKLRRGMRWEEASQQTLVDICRELKVNGALVTNVVFVPVEDTSRERNFVSQVDHVLLTESGGVIIEAKNWRGLVFDGLTPSSVHSSFAGLVDEDHLRPPFAIQITNHKFVPREGTIQHWWQLRAASGSDSPCQQTRVQASRLAKFVQRQLGVRLWFSTCVFYSHPDATVHANPQDRTEHGIITAVTRNRTELRNAIRNRIASTPKTLSPDQLKQIIELFATQGAHIERFGA